MVTVLLLVLGFCAGLLGALTGIGGGVLLTPILALHFGIPIREAIGTSLVAVITTSAASSSVHLQRHTTDIRLGMTLELATSLGAAVMAYLVGYFNRNALEGLFAAFLLYSSIMGYSRSLYEVASEAQSEYSKLAEERMGAFQQAVSESVEQAARSAPGGSDVAVAAIKSQMAATTAAFDSFTKASRHLASFTDAGLASASRPAKSRK